MPGQHAVAAALHTSRMFEIPALIRVVNLHMTTGAPTSKENIDVYCICNGSFIRIRYRAVYLMNYIPQKLRELFFLLNFLTASYEFPPKS